MGFYWRFSATWPGWDPVHSLWGQNHRAGCELHLRYRLQEILSQLNFATEESCHFVPVFTGEKKCQSFIVSFHHQCISRFRHLFVQLSHPIRNSIQWISNAPTASVVLIETLRYGYRRRHSRSGHMTVVISSSSRQVCGPEQLPINRVTSLLLPISLQLWVVGGVVVMVVVKIY